MGVDVESCGKTRLRSVRREREGCLCMTCARRHRNLDLEGKDVG